jgi:hypothetical protein
MTVTLSSTEAEYIAAIHIIQEGYGFTLFSPSFLIYSLIACILSLYPYNHLCSEIDLHGEE